MNRTVSDQQQGGFTVRLHNIWVQSDRDETNTRYLLIIDEKRLFKFFRRLL